MRLAPLTLGDDVGKNLTVHRLLAMRAPPGSTSSGKQDPQALLTWNLRDTQSAACEVAPPAMVIITCVKSPSLLTRILAPVAAIAPADELARAHAHRQAASRRRSNAGGEDTGSTRARPEAGTGEPAEGAQSRRCPRHSSQRLRWVSGL